MAESEVQVRPDKLEVVASFYYLGDMLSAGGCCDLVVTTHAWVKVFRIISEFRISMESQPQNAELGRSY